MRAQFRALFVRALSGQELSGSLRRSEERPDGGLFKRAALKGLAIATAGAALGNLFSISVQATSSGSTALAGTSDSQVQTASSAAPGTCLDRANLVIAHIRSMIQLSDPNGDMTRMVSRQLPTTADSLDPGRLLGTSTTLEDYSQPVRTDAAVQAFRFISDRESNPVAVAAVCRDWVPVLVTQATNLCATISRFADVDPIGRIAGRSRAQGCDPQAPIEISTASDLRFINGEFKCEFFRVLEQMEKIYACAPVLK